MRALLLVGLLAAGQAAAQAEPPSSSPAAQELPPLPPPPTYLDPRLRELTYDPNAVVQLTVAPARQMTVMFAAGEQIASVAVGDSSAWQVTASRAGDSLFVKPTGGYVQTNMTVITDSRVYLFELVPGGLMDSIYLVRFVYPEAAGAAVGPAAPAQNRRRYTVRGAKVVRPDAIGDDGFKTYISWAGGKAMPAVFAIAPSGEEMLVDGYMRGGFYTIDRVYKRLIFRFDEKTATATRK